VVDGKTSMKYSSAIDKVIGEGFTSYCVLPMFGGEKELQGICLYYKGLILLVKKYTVFEQPERHIEYRLTHLSDIFLSTIGFSIGMERKRMEIESQKGLTSLLMVPSLQMTFFGKVKSILNWTKKKINSEFESVYCIIPSDDPAVPAPTGEADFHLRKVNDTRFGPIIEPCGLIALAFVKKQICLSQFGKNDVEYNSRIDADSSLNIISMPIMIFDQIQVGVLQLSGRLSISSQGIEETLYNTVKFISSYLSFFIVQHILENKADYPSAFVERLQDIISKITDL
jgi:hypothetical protein